MTTPAAHPPGARPLRGAIFDLDGTLADTLPLCIACFRVVFETHTRRAWRDDEITALFGISEEGMIERVLGDAAPAGVQRYLDEYERRHDTLIAPFPGLRDVLDALRARGIRLGLVTGKGPRSTAISLRRLGLERDFDRVECGSPTGAIKPAGIRAILGRWALPPADVAYIGDSASDMPAAAEAQVLPLGAGWAATATVRDAVGSAHPPAAVLERPADLLQFFPIP